MNPTNLSQIHPTLIIKELLDRLIPVFQDIKNICQRNMVMKENQIKEKTNINEKQKQDKDKINKQNSQKGQQIHQQTIMKDEKQPNIKLISKRIKSKGMINNDHQNIAKKYIKGLNKLQSQLSKPQDLQIQKIIYQSDLQQKNQAQRPQINSVDQYFPDKIDQPISLKKQPQNQISKKQSKNLKRLTTTARILLQNKYPQFPRKPLGGYFLFEQALVQQKKIRLTIQMKKVLSQQYKKLPKQQRQKYQTIYHKNFQEYKIKYAKFIKQNPDYLIYKNKLLQNYKQVQREQNGLKQETAIKQEKNIKEQKSISKQKQVKIQKKKLNVNKRKNKDVDWADDTMINYNTRTRNNVDNKQKKIQNKQKNNLQIKKQIKKQSNMAYFDASTSYTQQSQSYEEVQVYGDSIQL